MKTLEVTSHTGISLKNILFATDFSEAFPGGVAMCGSHHPPL